MRGGFVVENDPFLARIGTEDGNLGSFSIFAKPIQLYKEYELASKNNISMKSRAIISLLLLTVFESCNNQHPIKIIQTGLDSVMMDTVPVTANLIKLYWGNSDKVDSANPLELAMYYLNKSKFVNAENLLRKRYPTEVSNMSGLYAIRLPEEIEHSNYFSYIQYVNYNFFRVNDYNEDIGGEENEIGWALSEDSSGGPLTQLYFLQTLEAYYANIKRNDEITGYSIYDKEDHHVDIKDVDSLIVHIKVLKKKYKDSKRLDFLLANEYIIAKDINDALLLFDKLIKDNYYALPSLRIIIRYLVANSDTRLDYYTGLLSSLFPNECNLVHMQRQLQTSPLDSVDIICKPCIESVFQPDSVFAEVYIARYYLQKRLLSRVNAIVDTYIRNGGNGTMDDVTFYKEGNYYDMKMRALFLEKQYRALCDFANSKLKYTPILNIDTKDEFELYIEKLYKEYISTDLKASQVFFDTNFGDCFHY